MNWALYGKWTNREKQKQKVQRALGATKQARQVELLSLDDEKDDQSKGNIIVANGNIVGATNGGVVTINGVGDEREAQCVEGFLFSPCIKSS